MLSREPSRWTCGFMPRLNHYSAPDERASRAHDTHSKCATKPAVFEAADEDLRIVPHPPHPPKASGTRQEESGEL
ncbi:protein spinster 1-like protein [Anopheles sinensis]|uniref:Protein spinster 1-like protein n=1 Tax=Anopheles sinensis TaxID=74873 RepID=A0A084WSV8_ANOSI|nr:protein spinster 1-like protein [Anopheles sinensis]